MAESRYEAERRHGRAIVSQEPERIWGWRGPAGVLRADRRARSLIEAAGLRPGTRCLELGCGTGEFTTRLVDSGCDLVSIDISLDLVERCRARIGGRAQVVVGNIETGESLEGRKFDAIVGVSVLHHVDLDLCLRNTLSLLVPGGRYAFSEPNMANPQVWVVKHSRLVGRRFHETKDETAFFRQRLQRIFERAGFVVEVCEPFEFLHSATPSRLVPAVLRLEHVLEKTPVRAIAGSIWIAGRRPA